MNNIKHHSLKRLASALSLVLAAPLSAQAVEFDAGVIEGNVDTTLSFGTISRIEGRDNDIICKANGGNAYSCNSDDGNLNYDTGIISQVWKAISEVEVNHKDGNMGAFFRARAYVDTRNNDEDDTKHTNLSTSGARLIGQDLDLLDAYGWLRFDAVGKPAEVRFGKHVLNWGESTFIQGGINSINPVDMAALRAPGSELREALLPVNLLSASIEASDRLSLEGFYQLEWDKIVLEPAGSFFSTSDAVGAGGDKVYLGWGAAGVLDTETLLDVSRGPDDRPSDGGQWGVALRYLSEELNNTEFGLYYMNYHSRAPIVSMQTASGSYVTQAGIDYAGAHAYYTSLGASYAAMAHDMALGAAMDTYADGASYFAEYPEDIQMLGLSFNTDVGQWALQGEYSFKHDVPLQLDDVEMTAALLDPLYSSFPAPNPHQISDTAFGPDEYIKGYIQADVSQVQATATRVVGNFMGAEEFTFLAEAGLTHIHNMPDKDDLRIDGPGTFASGNEWHELTLGSPITEDADHFADATSWGYRVLGLWVYNDALPGTSGVNLIPHVAFSHDVSGVSPIGGNFLEDRKALSIGVGATYKEEWSADVSYTSFSGAGRYNLLNDRDYLSFSVKYSF